LLFFRLERARVLAALFLVACVVFLVAAMVNEAGKLPVDLRAAIWGVYIQEAVIAMAGLAILWVAARPLERFLRPGAPGWQRAVYGLLLVLGRFSPVGLLALAYVLTGGDTDRFGPAVLGLVTGVLLIFIAAVVISLHHDYREWNRFGGEGDDEDENDPGGAFFDRGPSAETGAERARWRP
jgi:hypothetical protein